VEEPVLQVTGHETPASPAFSDQLEGWLASDGPKTVGDLGVVFAEKSFAVTILVLMIFPAAPLPTGGITHVFEVITVLLGAEMVIGMRTIWLPARFRDRELGTAITGKVLPFLMKRVRWLERFSKPRAAGLFTQRWFTRILGLIFMVFALAAGLSPPFSGLDTLPSIGAVVVALGIILGDVVALTIGAVIGVAGIALSITVGTALVHFLRGLF
jgi:hypothetical protein